MVTREYIEYGASFESALSEIKKGNNKLENLQFLRVTFHPIKTRSTELTDEQLEHVVGGRAVWLKPLPIRGRER